MISSSNASILKKWDLTEQELTEIIQMNPSMRGLMLGYIAEYKLQKMHFSDACFGAIRKDDDHNRKKKGDLVVTYKGKEFRIECKSLQTNSIYKDGDVLRGKYQCDASDRRTVTLRGKKKIETTCLLRGEFDIIAVNLFAFDDKWRFCFALNRDLPCSSYKKYPAAVQKQLLATLMPVSWPLESPYTQTPIPLLERLLDES